MIYVLNLEDKEKIIALKRKTPEWAFFPIASGHPPPLNGLTILYKAKLNFQQAIRA
jgi:hypothetical protein